MRAYFRTVQALQNEYSWSKNTHQMGLGWSHLFSAFGMILPLQCRSNYGPLWKYFKPNLCITAFFRKVAIGSIQFEWQFWLENSPRDSICPWPPRCAKWLAHPVYSGYRKRCLFFRQQFRIPRESPPLEMEKSRVRGIPILFFPRGIALKYGRAEWD